MHPSHLLSLYGSDIRDWFHEDKNSGCQYYYARVQGSSDTKKCGKLLHSGDWVDKPRLHNVINEALCSATMTDKQKAEVHSMFGVRNARDRELTTLLDNQAIKAKNKGTFVERKNGPLAWPLAPDSLLMIECDKQLVKRLLKVFVCGFQSRWGTLGRLSVPVPSRSRLHQGGLQKPYGEDQQFG